MVCLSSLPFTGLNGRDPVARWYTVTPKLHKSTLRELFSFMISSTELLFADITPNNKI